MQNLDWTAEEVLVFWKTIIDKNIFDIFKFRIFRDKEFWRTKILENDVNYHRRKGDYAPKTTILSET